MSDEDINPIEETPQAPQQPTVRPPMLQVLPTEALAAVGGVREWIELPGDDQPIGEFAAKLGEALHLENFFEFKDEVVFVDSDRRVEKLRKTKEGKKREAKMRVVRVRSQKFRTMAERFCVFYKVREGERKETFTVRLSMFNDTAEAVLVSSQFRQELRELRCLNLCRLPVIREGGVIELLPTGYDDETEIFTVGQVPYSEDVGLADAVEVLRSALAEFEFVDAEQARAVAVAGMLGVFALGLLPPRSLRPTFLVVANSEGAGKTKLVETMLYPTFGVVAARTLPEREEEFEKVLLTVIREGRTVLFFDNVKGHLASRALEGFLSSIIWSGRLLGHSESIEGENLITAFITGNGLTISPDMRRRSLFIELHMGLERVEDREFEVELTDAAMRSIRPNLLGALWALVRNWDKAGRPPCSRPHSGFPAWARIIGGIVEAAGLGCCLAPAGIATAADKDGNDMRLLVQAMAETGKADFFFQDLINIAAELGCFQHILGETTPEMLEQRFSTKLDPAQCSRVGRLLGRYDQRQVGAYRFVIIGQGHSRRYRVERLDAGCADTPTPAGAAALAESSTDTPSAPPPSIGRTRLAREKPFSEFED